MNNTNIEIVQHGLEMRGEERHFPVRVVLRNSFKNVTYSCSNACVKSRKLIIKPYESHETGHMEDSA